MPTSLSDPTSAPATAVADPATLAPDDRHPLVDARRPEARPALRPTTRRLPAVLAAVLSALVVLVAGVVVGQSDRGPVGAVPGGFASWTELMAMQQSLNSAATAIQQAAAALPDSGYTGVVAAPENRRLDLYWKGLVPDAVRQVIDARGATVPIRLLPAPFAAAELAGEVRRLGQDPAIAEASPMVDGTGIAVRWAPGQRRDVLPAAAVPVIDTGLTADPEPVACRGSRSPCREDDAPPFYGGARTDLCTTGFSVSWNGTDAMLFAAHCGTEGTLVRDGGGQVVGPITAVEDERDTSLILVQDNAVRAYTGLSTGTGSEVVLGATFSNIGNWVCSSGSRSGATCSIQVTANGASVGGTFPAVVAEHSEGRQAIKQGDSGGPVYEMPPAGGDITAKGIISAGDREFEVPCTRGDDAESGRCSSRMAYLDVTRTLEFYGATLEVRVPQ